jgi:hypothetical protein
MVRNVSCLSSVCLLTLCVLGIAPPATAGQQIALQQNPSQPVNRQQLAGEPQLEPPRKQAHAMRVPQDSMQLDGRLDESAWETAQPIVDFLQQEPTENGLPVDAMEVRIVFDETALWVGARMHAEHGAVQAPMSRRDVEGQAEYLQIELDTFLDHRTAYMFGVTASGVRLDHFHPNDNENESDAQYDPVWRARTTVDDKGWTAEMWIPFSQLRFNESPERVWGLNIKRWRPTLNEQVYWVVIGRTNRGWASRFGELRGVEGVQPRRRLEVLPYVAGSSRVVADRDPNNPFVTALNPTGRVGADVKIGIGSNLTLDATINPDFGQVELDPAQVNLSVFEVFFAERRPFFIEGNSVLEAGTTNFYYSRRIGARPPGAATGDYVAFPNNTNIIGAAKLTGRFRNGTSVGFLGAVTDEARARVSTGGDRSTVTVAPRTEWAVGRVIKELDRQGSTVGAHVTMVNRNMDAADPLAQTLVRRAITTGVDTRIRFKDRTYEASGNVGLTFVNGEEAAIAREQRANGRFLQRLDQPNIRYDPTRRSLSGAQIQGNVGKIAGRHWLWNYNLQIETPEFNPVDFGRLNYAGDFNGGPRLTYRETRPGRFLRAYSSQWSINHYWYFDTDLGVRYTLNSNNSVTFPNFWVATANINRYFRGQDAQLTRGGPAMGTPLGWQVTTSLRNRSGANTAWTAEYSYRSTELGDTAFTVGGSISARPTPSLQLSVTPEYSLDGGTNATFSGPINRQYLRTITGSGRPEQYGNRYIFGVVDRSTLSTQFRVNYTFKPDVTLEVYAEPFAASVRSSAYGEMLAARNMNLRVYGTDGTTIARQADGSHRVTDGATTFSIPNDWFNRRSFRSNMVLRWEWRPGSILFVVWQQNRAGETPIGNRVGVGDLFDSWSAPGDNIFAVKTTVWFSR